MSSHQTPNASQTNLKIVKTEIKPSGESVQLVRPYAVSTKSTAEIVGDLVNNFSYRTAPVKASESELNAVQQAFGSSLAQELIKTYDGSNLVSDSQQDLIGERYLAEQIKLIERQQKGSSVLDKWSHLLYEGEKYENGSAVKKSDSQLKIPVTETVTLRSNPINLSSQKSNSSTQLQKAFSNSFMSNQLLIEAQAAALARDEEKVSPPVDNSQYQRSQSNTKAQAEERAEARFQAEEKAQAEARERQQQQERAQAAAKAQAEVRLEAAKARLQEEDRQSMLNAKEEPPQYKHSTSQHSRLKHSSSQNVQQPQDYLPQLSSSNLNSVTLDAYDSPQFKAMLEQLLKPINMPPEQINYPADWPSQDKIYLLAEPIYIPAPQPIVIPAPNIITTNGERDFPEDLMKPKVTYFPSIANDQMYMKNFGIRQINLD